MLGVSTEKGRELLGDSYFKLRILLKPMVKERDMRVRARFTVTKRSSSIKKKTTTENQVTILINYQILTKRYSTFSQVTVSRS